MGVDAPHFRTDDHELLIPHPGCHQSKLIHITLGIIIVKFYLTADSVDEQDLQFAKCF